jgi:hypothetical protein
MKHHRVCSRKSSKIKRQNQKSLHDWGADTRTTTDDSQEEWTYLMVNNQFDATTFLPFAGLLTGGSKTQARELVITFRETPSASGRSLKTTAG